MVEVPMQMAGVCSLCKWSSSTRKGRCAQMHVARRGHNLFQAGALQGHGRGFA